MTYQARKIRLTRRALPVKGKNLGGDNNDANRYFRCKHCGAIIDSRKTAVGDGDGRVVQDYQFEDPDRLLRFPSKVMQKGGYEEAQPNYSAIITMSHVDHNHEGLMENGIDGDPMPIRHDLYPVVVSGCWFCGSLNWR